MKFISQPSIPGNRLIGARRTERGMATIFFVALLVIIMVLVVSNAQPVVQFRLEEKAIERQQIERLIRSQTNAVPVVKPPALQESR